jgi:hypothetical protein
LTARSAILLFLVLAATFGLTRAQVVSVSCKDNTSDAATLNAAISGSAAGAQIQIHGTCLVNQTVVLYPSRSYLGDSRTGTVIQQANGANLSALVASQGWVTNSSTADAPVTVAHMTLNGNSQNNNGTTALVIRSGQTTIEDMEIKYAPADGIQFTSTSQNGTAISTAMVHSRVSNVFVTNSGANGIHVIDPGNAVTDSDALDSWIALSGKSAIAMDNAAGWKLRGNHLYGVQQNAIYAQGCFGTMIEGNYVEDFGDAGGATYYGIACTIQGATNGSGAGSVIAKNKVFQLRSEPASGTWIYIGVPSVSSGIGILNVVDNVVVGANTNNDIGLSYLAGSGLTMLVQSENNVNAVHTGRILGAGVTVAATDGSPSTLLTPTVAVSPSQNALNSSQSLTVPVTVTGSGTAPTGTVTLAGGGYTSSAPGALSNGTFTFTIPANSLNAGTDTLTANYSGDSNYAPGAGSASVMVTQSVFTLAASAPNAISSPGGSTASTITVTSTTGYAGQVTLTCALTGYAMGAADLPTCSLPSATVTAGGKAIATVSTTGPTGASVSAELRVEEAGAEGAVLAFLGFLWVPRRRRSWRPVLGALVLVVGLCSLGGCGGGSSSASGQGGASGTSAGSYVFTVTGTGNPSISPAPTTTFTVTVN